MTSSETPRENCALITGASSGIGEATALTLAARGYELILLARREERLAKLAEAVKAAGAKRVSTHTVDVQDRAALEALFQTNAVQAQLESLTVVINNAGLAAGVDPMPTGKPADWDAMIDTNIKGLLTVTRLALAALTRNRGHVVNLGSVAGHWAYPGGGVYCATKAAVKILSEALRLDLQGTGVRVTNIEPGMVETEFSAVRLGDRAKADAVYNGMTPLSAEDIAESIVWCLERPAHVNIQELMIFPTDQAGVGFVHRRV